MADLMRKRHKLSDLTDEQLLNLIYSVQLEELLSDETSEDGDDELDMAGALNAALEDGDSVSFAVSAAETEEQACESTKKHQKDPDHLYHH